MKQMLMQLKPRTLDDIIAAIALYRPGPMDSIPKYIEARHDRSKIKYCTPLLAPILDVTYGCIVYQEQVMQIFREIAGYSFGHADVVRRAISKKKQGVIDGEKQAFIDGAVSKGIDRSDAKQLFGDIVSFANYAFNKSHAAAYAVLSFRTAYLKTHYPLEYESALLTSVLSSTEKLSEYIADCGKQGIRILPPDINKSRGSFHVENSAIRFGLTAIRNIGDKLVGQLIAERDRNGIYESIDDFIERTEKTDLNKRALEMLIKSGAMDSLGVDRSKLLAVYEGLLDKRGILTDSSLENQIGMFDSMAKTEIPRRLKIEFPDVKEFTAREKLMLEKESCGIYLSGHVLDDYKKHISALKLDRIIDIRISFADSAKSDGDSDYDTNYICETEKEYTDKSSVLVVGCVTKRTNKATKSGEQMAFVTIEDYTSSIEILVFPKTLQRYGYLLAYDSVIAVSGTLSVREDEEVKILCDKIIPLISDNRFDNEEIPVIESRKSANTAKNAKKIGEDKSETKITVPKNTGKVFLRVNSETSSEYKKARAFCGIFTGNVPAVFYISEKSEYMKDYLMITADDFVINELREMLGNENVVLR